jgi:uncharacterized damage-inducible protein DinB
VELPEYFQQLYDYAYWANARVLAAAETLNEGQLRLSQAGGWGSLISTLQHIYNAEWVWLQRWQGDSPRAFPDWEATATIPALQSRWRALEAEMRAFLAAQTSESLRREVNYTSMRGENLHQALWQMLAHVANHGTHHRGEVAAMFAHLGVAHQEEDANHYFLERSGQR